MSKMLKMVHETDPAQEILKKAGDLSKFEIMGNYVLIGVYQRPEKTTAGLYIPDATRQEDAYQGKAGLVLGMGPSAFVSDSLYNFRDQKVEVGDWVSIWVSDGRKLMLGDSLLCRLVEDQHIRLKIPAPDAVY